MTTYTGNDIVRGYRRWFGVDKVCALVELRMCGAAISEEMIASTRREVERLTIDRAKKKGRRASEYAIDQDDHFSFIAGHTSGGTPYGVTWEEWDPFAEDDYGRPDDRIVNANMENIRERLVELGAERLADAIAQLAKSNSQANDMVKRLIASPAENITRFKTNLAELKNPNRYIDWRGTSDFARELELVLADLETGCDDPETGTDLMIAFFEADKYIFEQCNDSSGNIGDVFNCLARDLFVRYASDYPDKAQLVKKLVETCKTDDYGVRSILFDAAYECLPEDTFQQLADRLPQVRRRKTPFRSSDD